MTEPGTAPRGTAPGAPPARFLDLCLDARDHHALADWWCTALGYRRAEPRAGDAAAPEDPVLLVDPTGAAPRLWVNPVPEPKAVKNRMHVDVVGDRDALLALGATLLRARDDAIHWDVLADPEGNELCCFAPDD
ncbi:VOC family protein [Actinotalea solisilvae]|uniref:VOC family protein n=1 Tax=Actinotalea solisilvae TaxID=2072922 RepID=UPI0018F19EE6|nr:VOC family protein [Actinotalea solisilvae]